MKRIFTLCCIVLVSFTSCFYPRKIDKWVAKKYPDTQFKSLKPKSDNITITSPLVKAEQKASITKQKVKNFLPLIVWWQYDCYNTCTLNPNIALNTFNAAVQSYGRSKPIAKKLNGQKLQLSIEEIPNAFQVIDKGRLIFPIIGWNRIYWRPFDSTVKVSWTLTGVDTQPKIGVVTLNSIYKGSPVGRMHSRRRITGMYFDGYEADLKTLAKQLVDQIVTEADPSVASTQ